MLVGVATAGFQIEGGYNGAPDGDGPQPANNWATWERAGRVEPAGVALDFWNRYEEHLDRAAAIGGDLFRLSVEWARCEPAPAVFDEAALDRYAAILDACRARGLEPMVTLHHFTHPAWLGEDFWLHPDAPERFAAWAATAADRLADRCRYWVTINEINVLALQTYVLGMFPPGRRFAIGATVRCLDHLLAGHVLAYEELKRRRPDAVVATNNYAFSIYELDRLLIDVLLSRSHGVDRYALHNWLSRRRLEYHRAANVRSPLERAIRRRVHSAIPLDKALPRSVAAVHASPHDRTLDVVQVDYYQPVVARHVAVPGHRTAGGRTWLPARMLWDDHVDPSGLTRYLELNHEPGLPLWVVENGLCNRVKDGRRFPRDDGWTRPRYLDAHVDAILAAVDAGLPVEAYVHWTLADNYEWGSYEPRFGVFGVDRRYPTQWSNHDSMGDDAAGAFRAVAGRLRAV